MNRRVRVTLKRSFCIALASVSFASSVLPVFAQDTLPRVYEGTNDFDANEEDVLSESEMEKLIKSLQSEYRVKAVEEIEAEPSKEYVEYCDGIVEANEDDALLLLNGLAPYEVIIGESMPVSSNDFTETDASDISQNDIDASGNNEDVSDNEVNTDTEEATNIEKSDDAEAAEAEVIDNESSDTEVSPVSVARVKRLTKSNAPVNVDNTTENPEPAEDTIGEDENIHFYPLVSNSGLRYTFNGLSVGGAISDTENLVKVVVSVPNSDIKTEITGFDYTGTDTWKIENPIAQIDNDKPYRFLVEVYYEKDVLDVTDNDVTGGDTQTQPTYHKETIIKRSYSKAFLVHEVKRGENVKTIANGAGALANDIKRDNGIGLFNPRVGSTLFVRNTSLDYEPSFEWTDEAIEKTKEIGATEGTEYAYGFVNLATLSLMYDEEDLNIKEYESFSLIRHVRSELCDVRGYFGYGVTSLFDEKIMEVSEDKYLYLREDFHGVMLTKSGDYFVSDNGKYTLKVTEEGFELTDLSLNYEKFDKTGAIKEKGTKKGKLYLIEYDENENPIKLVTRAGKEFQITVNNRGLISEIINPDGTKKTYTYNPDKLLSKVTNERGKDSTYNYDSARRLLSALNQMGKEVLCVSYDDEGKVSTYKDGEGKVSTFKIDSVSENDVVFTDAKGVTTVYTKDANNRHERIKYSDGKEELKTYDSLSNVLSVTDKAGNKTLFEYDEKGRLVKETDASNLTVTYAYDSKGNLISETDANGNTTTYSYDDNNNPVLITYPDNTETKMTFDGLSRMTSLVTAGNATTTYTYEGNSPNVISVTNPNGNVTTNTYDLMDRLLSTTSNGKTTTYTYSETGKQLSVTDPDGKTEEYEYDAADNSIGIKDPMGNTVGMRYDSLGRITQVVNADGTHTDFTYDANGNLLKEESSTGLVKTYTYNENDELVGEEASNGESINYERDSLGRVIKETYKDGATVTYEYHKTLDLITKKKDELDREVTYDYDNVGNLLKESYSNGLSITYTYDSNNRTTSVLDTRGIKTEYTYNSDGAITKESVSKNGQSKEKTYEYDANGNLVKETDYEGIITLYAYDSDDRLVKVTDALGYTTEYTYGATGETLSEKDRDGNVKRYEYDGNGNMTKMTDANGNVFEYSYDSQGRVTKTKMPDGSTTGAVYNSEGYLAKKIDSYGNIEEYSYDENGNIIKIKDALSNVTEYSYDTKNNKIKEIQPNGLTTKNVYNKLGWLTKVTYDNGTYAIYTYDYNGKVTSLEYSNGSKEAYEYSVYGDLLKHTSKEGVVTSYSYDDFGNVIKVESSKGDKETYTLDKNGKTLVKTDAKGNEITYVYDNRGALVKTLENDGKVTRFTYDGNENVLSIEEYFEETVSSNDVSSDDVSGDDPSSNDISSDDVSSDDVSGDDTSGNDSTKVSKLTLMEYDGNGNIIKVTYPDGSFEESTYDYNKNILTKKDKNGNVSTYTYDSNGNVKTATTPLGNTYTYGYDDMGNLSYVEDPYGNIESYTYNSMGLKESVTSPNGAVTTYEYSKEGLLTKETDALSNTIKHEYDLYGNCVKTIYPNGIYEEAVFDNVGRIIKNTDVYGLNTFYTYDENGNVVRVMSEVSNKTLTGCVSGNEETVPVSGNDSTGNDVTGSDVSEDDLSDNDVSDNDVSENDSMLVKSNTVIETIIKTFTYDEFNRFVKEETEGLVPTLYVYDNKDRIVKTLQGEVYSETFYDKWGNVEKETDSEGNVNTYVYDKADRVVKENVNGVECEFTYDNEGNVLKTSLSDNVSQSAVYDADGQKISETDANGNTTLYTYDKLGRVIAITDALNKTSRYEYDANGNLTKEISTDGVETTYGYDILGRLVKVTDPDKTTVYYEYDSMGNLVKETTCDEEDLFAPVTGEYSRRVCVYRYSKTGELVSYGSEGEVEEEYDYYPGGNVKTVTYPSKKSISYEYDIYGNTTGTYFNDKLNTKREYNDKLEPVKLTDETGTTEYTYDNLGRLVETKAVTGSVKYTYDSFGNKESITYPDNTKVSYEYDEINRLKSVTDGKGVTTVYEYDNNGNVISEESSDGLRTETEYDALNRKTLVTTKNGEKEVSSFSYKFDNAGRISSEADRDENTTVYKGYRYDAAGKLIKYAETKNLEYYEDDFASLLDYNGREDVSGGDISGEDVSSDDVSGNSLSFDDYIKTKKDVKVVTYEYDTFSNRTKEITYSDGKKSETAYEYNRIGQLEKKLTDKKCVEKYTYDKDGNLVKKESDGKVTTYTYTVDNKLKDTVVNGQTVESVSYDGNGLKSYSVLRKEYGDTIDEKTKLKIVNNQKDIVSYRKATSEDTRVSREEHYIPGTPDTTYSEVTGSEDNKFMLTAARLVGAFAPVFYGDWYVFAKSFSKDVVEEYTLPGTEEKSYVLEDSDTTEESEYNRIRKIQPPIITENIKNDTSDITIVTYEPSYFVYDLTSANPEVLCEESSVGNVSETYTYGYDTRISSGSGDKYVYDGRGSVSEVIKNKRVTASYDYDPYGKIVSGAPAQERVWAYNGEEYTPQTGFIYLRARNYDPSTGTFTSKDTYLGDKTSPVTRNRYTYGNNNPVMYEDPSGHAGLLNKITSAVKSAASSVAKTVTKAATTVTNTVKSVANTVSTAVKSAVNTVTTTVKKAATTVVNTVKSAATTVKNTATTVVNKVTSTAKTVVNNVKSTVSNAVSTVKNTVSTVYNNVSQAYTNVINDYGSIGNFVVSEVSNAYVAVKNCVVNLGDKAEVKVKAVWSDTKAFVKDSYDLAVQGYQSVSQKVQEANQWWKDNVSEPFKSTVKENFIEPIKEMKESAKAFVNKAADELQNTFESIGESVSKGWNSFTTWCGEHEDELYAIGSAVLIGGLAIATVFCPALAPITIGACAGFISGFGMSVATSVVSSTIQNGFGNYDWDGILRQANKEAFWGAASGALFSGASMAASKALSKLGPKAANTVKEISGCVNVVDDYADDAGRGVSEISGYLNVADDYVDDVGRAATKGGKGSNEFFIDDWTGYPEELPKPEGPFRILEGEEYNTARDLANKTNANIHKSRPDLKGTQIHEMHPVKFGGSPTDIDNKIALSPKEHARYTAYWNKVLRNMKNGGN